MADLVSHAAGPSNIVIRTPKLTPSSTPTLTGKYYAGFQGAFVEDVLDHMHVTKEHVLLDPWNGSGTTTRVGADRGISVIGVDINPVLVVVAKGRLLGANVSQSLLSLVAEVIARSRVDQTPPVEDEALEQWFTRGTARYLRSLERGVHHLLVDSPADMTTAEGLDRVSSLAAWFYAAVFETVRSFVGFYQTSNPTWVKVRAGAAGISVSRDAIDARLRAVTNRRQREISRVREAAGQPMQKLILGSSTTLTELAEGSVDACLTSPPYCTRIDYAVLTRPELAVLTIGAGHEMRALRGETIGTTTIATTVPSLSESWGDYVVETVETVSGHESKSSKSYYVKYYLQYFDSMYKSLEALRRVTKAGSPCGLVVQDSYYKDVHIDLARAVTELGEAHGWGVSERFDFKVPHRRANMNPAARQYKRGVSATESLLILR